MLLGPDCYTLPGILALLRAIASSTALSCLRSSSLRDKVLALPVLVAGAEVAASGAFPGMLVTLDEPFGRGEAGRFLSG